MRNLSNREALTSLLLIAASCLAAYRLWFAPALAQTERDRVTLERLVSTLARRPAKPTAGASLPPAEPASVAPPLSPPPQAKRQPRKPKQLPGRPALELACANDKDPLCGALDR